MPGYDYLPSPIGIRYDGVKTFIIVHVSNDNRCIILVMRLLSPMHTARIRDDYSNSAAKSGISTRLVRAQYLVTVIGWQGGDQNRMDAISVFPSLLPREIENYNHDTSDRRIPPLLVLCVDGG